MFHSVDNGEFGGEVVTPAGNNVGGHYKFVFDLEDKVYAISSFEHLFMANTSITRFDNAQDFKCIYSSKDMISQFLFGKDDVLIENIVCGAVDVKKDEAYAALYGKQGTIERLYDTDILRLIRIKDGKAEIIKEYTGKVPTGINSLIVDDKKIYIGCDKMLCILDMETLDLSNAEYRTCISKEDEKNIHLAEIIRI